MEIQWLSGSAVAATGTGLDVDWLSGDPFLIR